MRVMRMALTWGGRLAVMAPLCSICTQSPREKQQAWSVFTKTCCRVQQSQTRSWQHRTSRTTAVKRIVSIASKIVPSNRFMLCRAGAEGASSRRERPAPSFRFTVCQPVLPVDKIGNCGAVRYLEMAYLVW